MKGKKVERITGYKTTDSEIFLGGKAKKRAESHQKKIDFKLKAGQKLDKFDTFMRGLFGIKVKYDPDVEWEDEERDFCDKIMGDVMMNADDGDFRGGISSFFLDLFAFVGPDKWLKIHKFITKEM